MILILFAIQTFLLLKLYVRFGFKDAIFLIYSIVYFYCNAIVIDLYFLLDKRFYQEFIMIDRESIAFIKSIFSYTLFLVTYYLLFSFTKKKIKTNNQHYNILPINKFLISISSIIMLFFILKNFSMVRLEVKNSSNFFTTFLLFIFSYYWAYIIFSNKKIKNIYIILYSLIFLLYSVFSYEREPILLIIITLLIKFRNKINFKIIIPISFLIVFIIFYYKAFYQILLVDFNYMEFFDYVKSHPISLSKMDPSASFALLYDYFDSRPVLYYNYDFTYFTSFIDQIKSLFGFGTTESMSKVVSKHYVGDSYGLAYSMILESLINFWFFGPVFLAVMTKVIYTFLKRKFYYLNEIIDLMCIIFFLSFVRTELIVMSKIFIFPMIIFLSISHFYYLKNKNYGFKSN